MKSYPASISLISLIIISAFTLILVIAASSAGLSNYDQSFNVESSKISYYMAEACLEEALIRTEGDNTFSSTSLILDADTDCSVAVTGADPKTITITVNFLDYTQTFQAEVSLTQTGQIYNSELLTWEEI
jgi:hypothetical protein